ncbi:MAG: redox-sensing transcriptional repressor Rex [Planctomycetota bacterium]
MNKNSGVPKKIPAFAVKRLFLYHRALMESRGQEIISSDELSRLTRCSAAQIRKDLTYFGQFGTPGRGYYLEALKKHLTEILGINQDWSVALIGLGNLGRALLTYEGFKTQGFKIAAVFDNDPEKIGMRYQGVFVSDMSRFKKIIQAYNIKIAIMAVPPTEAQEIVNQLSATGIEGILNFVPYQIHAPENIRLLNIDMAIELGLLSYHMTHSESWSEQSDLFNNN